MSGAEFYKGKNIATSPDFPGKILTPGVNKLLVEVGPGSFPLDVDYRADDLKLSIRSGLAQAGIGVHPNAVSRLRRSFEESGDKETFTSKLFLRNYTGRNIILPPGLVELGRLFRPNEPLRGSELRSLVGNSQTHPIFIEGRQGVEWDIVFDPTSEEIAIKVVVEPQRFWIPSSDDPVFINPSLDHLTQRQELEKYFEPIPRGRDKILWIGQTQFMSLKGVDAILDSRVYPRNGVRVRLHRLARHIDSHLIDDGSNWPIKVEVHSRTDEKMPDYVLFTFYKS